MDLYTLAAASLTTTADRKRRPVVDVGQVARTFALVFGLAMSLVLVAHQQHASARTADVPTAPAITH